MHRHVKPPLLACRLHEGKVSVAEALPTLPTRRAIGRTVFLESPVPLPAAARTVSLTRAQSPVSARRARTHQLFPMVMITWTSWRAADASARSRPWK